MMNRTARSCGIAVGAALVAMLAPGSRLAAQTSRPLDLGPPAGDSSTLACTNDSLIGSTLNRFNAGEATRTFGGSQTIPASSSVAGNYYMFQGGLRLDGTIRGDIILLNSDLRITRTGAVTGSITVIGGHTILEPGASVPGPKIACESQVSLTRLPNNSVARLAPMHTINNIASAFTARIDGIEITPHFGLGQYNRIEALPLHVGVNALRAVGAADTARVVAYAIPRTGRDPNENRPSVGWAVMAQYDHHGGLPFSISLEGGSTIDPTRGRAYSSFESGASAFFLRRDYFDWYLRRGGSATISIQPTREWTFSGTYDISHQTSVLAIDALSLFRSNETWRPNTLIDDGNYHTLLGAAQWDGRDPVRHPVLSWLIRGELRSMTGDDLTPVALPTAIRDAVPTQNYQSSEGELDARFSLRLNPEQRVNFRVAGGGYLGGDPMTIQRRRSVGSSDPLIGYDFRAINCDRQRKPFASIPALCDRSASIQAEYRRTLQINLSTRINGVTIGVRRPELVFFGDAASAWLAGDSAGRVPKGSIQSIREWRSDVGIGVTSGSVGLFLSKAVADALPVRFTLLFNKRFF